MQKALLLRSITSTYLGGGKFLIGFPLGSFCLFKASMVFAWLCLPYAICLVVPVVYKKPEELQELFSC